jgi:uncharacterized protein YjdB
MRFSRSKPAITLTAWTTLILAAAACDSHIGRIAGINGPINGTGTGGNGTGTDTVVVASITVSPSSATMTVGTTQSFSATARNAAGATISASVLWSSSNNAVATVDASGVVKALAAGTATIIASSGSVSGRATVTITALSAR